MCAHVAAQCEDGGQVDLQHGVPVGVRELVGWVPLLDTAAIEQNVDSVAVGEDLGGQGCDGFVGGEVGSVDCCFAAEFLYGFFCLLIRLIALGIDQWMFRGVDSVKCTWTRRISAPASARAIAIDCPMPLVPPVTRAVWPSSE